MTASSGERPSGDVQAIFNAIADGMLRFDKNLVITAVNRAEAKNLGLEPSEIIGKRCQDLYHETIEGCPLCNLWDPLETGECLTSYDASLPCASPKGRSRPHVDLHFYPITDQDGEIIEIVVQIRDISERKRLEVDLSQVERLTALGGWIAGVAHELNNPLTGVLGYAEVALGRTTDPAVREALEIIIREADRMRRILLTLLSFSRKSELTLGPVDLHEVIDQMILLRSSDARAADVTLCKAYCDHLPLVLGSAVQLQQVVLNLMGNAIDAVRSSGRAGAVYLETRTDGNFVVLDVRDDGPGIPAAVQSRLFEPFFTTKPNGEGTGLGLSVSAGIVTRHGGTITVESEEGKGSCFRVRLPSMEPVTRHY